MKFYVSWYPGDPYYSSYDNDCSLLVSITSVARDWTINNFPRPPKRLLIDSGGYRFASAPNEALSPAKVLERQLALLNSGLIPTIICARDYPILDTTSSSKKKDQSITQTIAYAYELKNLLERKHVPDMITPMAIIQGDQVDALAYCAQELQRIGFPIYGLGSLAELRHHNRIMERVTVVAEIVGPEKLHIFGISGIKTVLALREMDIKSIDSSRPAKAAAYNEILYSNPYRRFGILEADHVPFRGRFPRNRRLQKALPCECPVCTVDPGQIMVVGKRANIRSRALHNYFHLKNVFCATNSVASRTESQH